MLAALLSLGIGAAMAQPIATSADRPAAPVSGLNTDKAEVSEQELLGHLGDTGNIHGHIVIPDTRAATLIQPEGRMWRDYRRGPLLWIAGVLVLGMLGVLAVFYAVKGRIMIPGGRGLATILRFTAFERFMHWLTATSWCVLAVSGLNMAVGRVVLLPLIGPENFTTLSGLLKYAHNFIAFPFIAGIVLMFLLWLRDNIPNRGDVTWFAQGGGLIGNAHPPAGKFNGGQKMVFWVVVLGGGALALTGLALLFPFYVTDILGMQLVQVIHGGIALLMIAAMLGHIYIGTVGMEGAIDAMNSGIVDLKWARKHHNLWVAEELAKSETPPNAAE